MGVLPGWWLGESDGRAEVSTPFRLRVPQSNCRPIGRAKTKVLSI